MSTTKPIIRIKNVVKTYGETKALDGLSFSVNKGEIVGLLGPNGAGKTTIIKVLSTLLKPDSGSVTVDGKDILKQPQAVRESIGLAGQFAAVDDILTGRQNLEMVGRLYHMNKSEIKKQIENVLDQVNLTRAADRSVKTYSGGMRRRLDLGASLMFTPKILFLDEPTTGLDPKTRRDLWATIRNLVKQGVTLLLTTQYLEEADELADRIVVINKGKVIAEGTSSQLKRQIRGDVLELELNNNSDVDKAKVILHDLLKTEVSSGQDIRQLRMTVKHGVADLKKALDKLGEKKIAVNHLSLAQPTLDEVFLELTEGGEDIE